MCGVRLFVSKRVSEPPDVVFYKRAHLASGQQCLVFFVSPQENGAKESVHRSGEPHPLVAPSLEFKQHPESSRRLVYQGEPHPTGAVRNSV